ncbi:MAG TPA: alpha/beta fold hydrolase [Actinomycetota bacterium]|nr:alpha/beta fold hydrolase [Actinomycetota bacterium]
MGVIRRLTVISAAAALAFVLNMAPTGAVSGDGRLSTGCRDSAHQVHQLVIRVNGEPAQGIYSLPARKPRGLVVFAHGYGHTTDSWEHHAIEASRHGLIAVAMNYRGLTILPDSDGDGLRNSRGWPAMAGAEDSIAAARLFEAVCRPPTVTIFGVSMGGNMSGLAVAIAGEEGITRADGKTPLFDYWIDVEGVANLTETYSEARLIAPANAFARQAQQDIEAETGGPIEQRPQAFQERTVVSRVDDVADAIRGAVVIHGLDDGLVPYNQGREMASALRGAGVDTDMITVGLKDEDSERETTLTGYAGSAIDPQYRSPVAGHASEKSTTHIVMETAFERLWSLVEGRTPGPYRECLANGLVPAMLRTVCLPSF